MKAFEKVCIRLNTFTGVLSGVLIVLTMLVIVANIAGRYLFNSPLLGSIELCRTLLVIIHHHTLFDRKPGCNVT